MRHRSLFKRDPPDSDRHRPDLLGHRPDSERERSRIWSHRCDPEWHRCHPPPASMPVAVGTVRPWTGIDATNCGVVATKSGIDAPQDQDGRRNCGIDPGRNRVDAGPGRIDASQRRTDATQSRINATPGRADATRSRADATLDRATKRPDARLFRTVVPILKPSFASLSFRCSARAFTCPLIGENDPNTLTPRALNNQFF